MYGYKTNWKNVDFFEIHVEWKNRGLKITRFGVKIGKNGFLNIKGW